MPHPVFDAEKEIPDLVGKVILVTGGTCPTGVSLLLSFDANAPIASSILCLAHLSTTEMLLPRPRQGLTLSHFGS